LPPPLAAAKALDNRDTSQPLTEPALLGRLITATTLRQRAKTTTHLACLSVGVRALPMRQRRPTDPTDRVIAYLRAIISVGELGLAD
jgi:hypothetical protein